MLYIFVFVHAVFVAVLLFVRHLFPASFHIMVGASEGLQAQK